MPERLCLFKLRSQLTRHVLHVAIALLFLGSDGKVIKRGTGKKEHIIEEYIE